MSTRLRRAAYLAAPVAGLVVLSPFVGEYLLGNTPLSQIVALPFLAPLYGAGAVVAREIARRTGRGWPTILLLALAYGVLEEGIATQMLFNPHYGGASGPSEAYLPGVGFDVLLGFQVLAMHTVWSIAAPIAVVEALVGEERRTAPWLGRAGLGVAVAVLAGGVALGAYSSWGEEHFVAAPYQLVLAAVVIAGLVVLALATGRRRTAPAVAPAVGSGPVPPPLVVAAVALVLSSAYFLLSEGLPGRWTEIAVMAGLAAVAVVLGLRYGRRPGWSDRHRFAAAAGALLTYVWMGFTQTPYRAVLDTAKTVGQAVVVVVVLALLALAVRRLSRRRADERHGPAPSFAGRTR